MKRAVCLVLCAVLALALCLPAAAGSWDSERTVSFRGITIELEGRTIAPHDANGRAVEPLLLNGTTFLPVRAIAGALGLGVEWDAKRYRVTLTSGAEPDYGEGLPRRSNKDETVTVCYRDISIWIDGEPIYPVDAEGRSVKLFIIGGTVYLPVRALAEALGLAVEWDGRTNTISLTKSATRTIEVRTYMKDIAYKSDGSKAVVEAYWKYDELGRDIVYEVFDNSVLYRRYTDTYDSAGRLIEERCEGSENYVLSYTYGKYGITSKIQTGDEPSEVYCYYNDKGQQTYSEQYYHADDDPGSGIMTFTYDAHGREVRCDYNWTGEDGTKSKFLVTHEYSVDGSYVVTTEMDDDYGYDYDWQLEKYNSYGELTDKYMHYISGGYDHFIYHNDSYGRTIWYEIEGTTLRTVYEYDGRGMLAKTTYWAGDEIYSIITYENTLMTIPNT